MPVAVIAILVTLNKDNVGTFVMLGIAIILTAFTFIEALVKTSKIIKKENDCKGKQN